MHDFINTITRMLSKAVFPALAVMAVGGVILALLYWRWYGRVPEAPQAGKRPSKGRIAAILLLLCYLGGLAAVTLGLRGGDGFRMGVQTRFLLAFREAWNAFTLQVWLNPLLNIAMFMPLGVLLPLAVPRFRRWFWTLAAGAGTSLVIETLQYLLCRGQADVDDLFCNTLGAMLGYCLCMAVVHLPARTWKIAGAYALFPALCAAALAGVFLAYYAQPYGNLADAPIFPADTSRTEWVLDCELSSEPGPAGVYWAEPFTKESCDAFAASFLSRVGASVDFARDVDYYDNTTYYSDHRTFFLLVDHNDRSYEYEDYRVDSDLRYNGEGGTITEAELRASLSKLGISVPQAAQFADKGKGVYAFRASNAEEGGVFYDGELSCRVAEGGVLYRVNNAMSAAAAYGEAPVISAREAYNRLCAGRFDRVHAFSFAENACGEVHVTSCELEYLTDSKGFRQPVYYFTLSDDQDEKLRGGQPWRVFVPALA